MGQGEGGTQEPREMEDVDSTLPNDKIEKENNSVKNHST